MNYHFTTTKAHFEMGGSEVLEIYCDDALETESTNPFKGNLDIDKFRAVIERYGAQNIPFVRMEATTNLIGGQPFSLANLHAVQGRGSQPQDSRCPRLQLNLRERVLYQVPRSGIRQDVDR